MRPWTSRLWIALGASLALAGVGGALHVARGLDAREGRRVVPGVTPDAWRVQGSQRRALPLGRYDVPTDGALRVTFCPVAVRDPHARLEVRHPTRAGARTAVVPLEAERERARPCYEGLWRAGAGGAVEAALVTTEEPPPAAREDVVVRTGALIRPWMAWPVVALLVGLATLVFAPRRAADDAPDPANEGAPRPTLWVVPSPWGALLALLAVHGVAMVLAEWLRTWLGDGAVTLLVSLVAQHGLSALAAAALLGAFTARDPRAALGLVPVGHEAFRKALAAAVGLVVVAVGTSFLLRDAGETPMAQTIASVPARYVVGFGALLAPISEELFFRGVLVSAFGRRDAAAGVATAAVVFTALHGYQLQGALLGLLPIGLLAVVNGYLRVSTRTLTVPWLVHVVYNGVLASTILFVA